MLTINFGHELVVFNVADEIFSTVQEILDNKDYIQLAVEFEKDNNKGVLRVEQSERLLSFDIHILHRVNPTEAYGEIRNFSLVLEKGLYKIRAVNTNDDWYLEMVTRCIDNIRERGITVDIETINGRTFLTEKDNYKIKKIDRSCEIIVISFMPPINL
ncbi:MAG: hypothetical protein AAFQ80_15170 [Cyanobacteria bacterium J06621_8]